MNCPKCNMPLNEDEACTKCNACGDCCECYEEDEDAAEDEEN